MTIRTLCLAGAMMLAAAPQALAEDYPKLHLRMGHFLPSTFSQANWDQWFADEVEKRSDGNVTVEIFWAGGLGGPQELLDLVSSGAIELAAFPAAYYPNELPLSSVVGSLPRMFKDAPTAHETTMAIFGTEAVQEEWEENNVHALLTHASNPYRIQCNTRVATMDDLEGLRIRAFGEMVPRFWQSVGATPVNIPAGEVYEAVQRGNLNCAYLAHDMIKASKIHEVAKYGSTLNGGALGTWQIYASYENMNGGWPQSVATLLEEVGAEAMQHELDAVVEAGAEAERTLPDLGVELVAFEEQEELSAAAADMVNLWLEHMKSRGHGEGAAPIAELLRPAAAELSAD